MELLVMLGVLVLLATLALKFGVDSRDRLQSKEEELAWIGMQWPASRMGLFRRGRVDRAQRFARHLVARALLALAHWLSPELRPTHAP